MLFTRCPNCETTFRITAQALGKAGGQVRCGRCACVFNAYAELREQRVHEADTALPPSREEVAAASAAETETGDDAAADIVADTITVVTQEIVSTERETAQAETENEARTEAGGEVAADGGADARAEAGGGDDAEAPQADVDVDAEAVGAVEAAEAAELDAASAGGDAVGASREGTAEANAARPAAGEAGFVRASAKAEGDEDADWIVAAQSFAADEAPLDAGFGFEPQGAPIAAPGAAARGRSPDAPAAEPDALDEFSVAAVLEQMESSSLEVEDEADAAASFGFEPPAARPARGRRAHARQARAKALPLGEEQEQGEAALDADADAEHADPLRWRLLDEPVGVRRASRAWHYAAVGAGLLLALQVLNHFRSDLASLDLVGPALRRAYAAVGVDVVPRWDVKQYEILDWVATAEPNANGRGSLKITARIQNKGPRVQPFPYVRLELKDRWEKSVAERLFRPAEYLTGSTGPDALMGPGATAHAELAVVDPGPDAYGFELDVCIEQPNHSLRCASDDVFR